MVGSTIDFDTSMQPSEEMTAEELIGAQETAAVRQIEWYLSRRNLATDYFLVQLLDSEFWVDLAVLAGFPKMLLIGIVDLDALSSLLTERSVEVQVRVRPGADPTAPQTYQVRPIYAVSGSAVAVATACAEQTESIATLSIRDAPASTTKEEIDAFLADAPPPATEFRLDTDGASWIAAYSSAEDARKAHDFVKGKMLGNVSPQIRVKVETRPSKSESSEEQLASMPAGHLPNRGVIYYPYPDGHIGPTPAAHRKSGLQAAGTSQSFQGRSKSHASQPPVTRGSPGPRKQPVANGRAMVPRLADGKVDINRVTRPKQPRSTASGKLGQKTGRRDGRDSLTVDQSRIAPVPAPALTETQFPPLGPTTVARAADPPVPRIECNNFAAKVAAAVAVAATAQPEPVGGVSTPDECPSSELENDVQGPTGDDLQISITSSLTPSPTPSERTDREPEEVPTFVSGHEKSDRRPQTLKSQASTTGSYASALLKRGGPAASPTSITREVSAPLAPSGISTLANKPTSLGQTRFPGPQESEADAAKDPNSAEKQASAPETKSIWSNKPSSIFQAPPPPPPPVAVTLVPAATPSSRNPKATEVPPGTATKRVDTSSPSARRKQTKGPKRQVQRNQPSHNHGDNAGSSFVRAPSPPPPILAGAWAKGSLLSALTGPSAAVTHQSEI